jgi:ABC-type nitrate/sulfonate/bicarbonate transport system substrate-binding protein
MTRYLAIFGVLASVFVGNHAWAQDKVTLAIAIKGLPLSPVFLAYDSGGLKKRGIEADMAFLAGGPPEIAALLAGDAQFGIGANDALLDLVKLNKVTCIYTFTNSYTQDVIVRNEFIAQRKITRDLDWRERVRRLKGATVGVIALGTTTDMAGRRLWKEAGMDPARDMTNVRVGALPAQIAALKQGSIDVFLASAPGRQIVEAQNIGAAVIQFGDVPSWADEPFEGILVRRDYLAAHPDVARRLVAAVAEAQKMIIENPKEAAAILKKGTFSNLDLSMLESALTQMKSAFRVEKMTAKRWQGLRDSRALVNPSLSGIEIKEGEDWTNEFHPQ